MDGPQPRQAGCVSLLVENSDAKADHDGGVTNVWLGGDRTDGHEHGIADHSTNPQPTREAPVGHRQPRADQVPSEKNISDPNNPSNVEDAALDRKIKSICRGC